MMPFEVSRLLVTIWLIVLTVTDVRRREVPHWFSTAPLLAVGAVFVARAGGSMLGAAMPGQGWDNLAIVLALIAVILSDVPTITVVVGFAASASAVILGTNVGQIVVFTWLLALAASLSGIMGAGDAKVIMLLSVFYPDLRLVIALLSVTMVVGLALMLWHARSGTGLWLISIARDLIALKVPARTGEVSHLNIPLVPLLSIGATAFLWMVA